MKGQGAAAPARKPALQVIVLGSGGGPHEFNTTAFLVRSMADGWRRGSLVALDAGVAMGSIARILERALPPGLQKEGEDSYDEDVDDDDNDNEDKAMDHREDTGSRALPTLPYTLTTGPFAGLEVPHTTALSNAAFIQRTLVDTYLITHPHLDHVAGFVINTAGLPGSRPKRLAGLPSTISAIKTHIFNNVIWPNLSDENNGAGLVTFMRLVEGGSPALGDGDGRGYVEISEGLAVKIWGVSHGHCIERHSHRGSGAGLRFNSMDAGSVCGGGGGAGSAGSVAAAGLMSPRILAAHHQAASCGLGPSSHLSTTQASSPLAQLPPQQYPPTQQQQQPELQRRDSLALLSGIGSAATASARRGSVGLSPAPPPSSESVCVYDSSAYFLRDISTGREVLMFGDVEPDSVSLSPRNILVWQEAAPKIASGHLAAIFVECSYDDSQPIDRLYGHLTPRFVVEEMTNLATEVKAAHIHLQQQQQRQNQQREGRKRKRFNGGSGSGSGGGDGDSNDDDRLGSNGVGSRTTSHSRRRKMEFDASIDNGDCSRDMVGDPVSPKTAGPPPKARPMASSCDAKTSAAAGDFATTPHLATPTADLSLNDVEAALNTGHPEDADAPAPVLATAQATTAADSSLLQPLPLQGLKVVIIHVKERLRDGPSAGKLILRQLRKYEAQNPLGCEYIISHSGQSLFL